MKSYVANRSRSPLLWTPQRLPGRPGHVCLPRHPSPPPGNLRQRPGRYRPSPSPSPSPSPLCTSLCHFACPRRPPAHFSPPPHPATPCRTGCPRPYLHASPTPPCTPVYRPAVLAFIALILLPLFSYTPLHFRSSFRLSSCSSFPSFSSSCC
ncbi:hypothetical protein CHARACLAT_027577 [Characodon lateralis]|uniref:Uncharacterized protein n=1 Tax=Characodon lateralis TaxID=208331 RepID=A0ABU7ENB0_9TELE|nr:hypothetical protein [Characodon lateralis]